VKGLRPPEPRHRSQQSPASRRASEGDREHRLEIRLKELANLVVVEGEPGRPETACVCTEIEPAGADTRLEDRTVDGLVGTYSVAENLVLDLYAKPPFSRGVALRTGAIRDNAEQRVREFDIRPIARRFEAIYEGGCNVAGTTHADQALKPPGSRKPPGSSAGARATGSVKRRRPPSEWLVIAAFLFPALALIGLYLIYPIVQSVQLSFFSWDGVHPVREFIGLDNWQRLASDGVFWQAFRNNVVLVFASIGLQLPIAMALAVVLDRLGRRLARVLRVLYFVPLLLSTVAIGVLFRSVYDGTFGLLNGMLELIGLDALTQQWLGQQSTALAAVIFVVVWQWVPFYMILFGAALADLPGDLQDAARVDGATENEYFFRVALPQLRPIIGVGVVLSLIGSLKYFDVVWVMTGGGPVHATELMATYMFTKSFRTNEVGYGATIASALFLAVLIASLATIAWSAHRRRTEALR
jgi:raffinose/stachyose/melibiose transport system permease protein